jgi:hypothetical protein
MNVIRTVFHRFYSPEVHHFKIIKFNTSYLSIHKKIAFLCITSWYLCVKMRRNMIKYEGFSNRTCTGIVMGEGIEATTNIPYGWCGKDPIDA